MRNITVMIADDHVLFIDGLKMLLSDEKQITIVDVARNGKELLEKLRFCEPDIILLDINMPVVNGLDSAKRISQTFPEIKIIMLSTYNEEHFIEKSKAAGARGYLLKNCNRSELLETIDKVFHGEYSFPNKALKHPDEFSDHDKFLKQFNLTRREFEIVKLIKQELTNQQIADTLYLSIYTVETHRKNIMQKLGINKPTALMKFIMENNL